MNATSTPAAAPAAVRATGNDLTSLLGEDAPRPWYRRRLTWIVVAAALLAAGAAGWWWRGRAANTAPTYATQAATRGSLTLTVTATGTLQPTRTISIGSELSGTVRTVKVDVNDVVRRGQVLVELDPDKLRDQVRRSEAALAEAQARVAQAVATVAESQAGLRRLEEVARLSGGQVPAKAELDTSRAAALRATADEASARAGVKDAEAALSTDRTNLSKASIVAPADGVVLTRSVDPGNAVAASLQAVTLFTIAEDLRHLTLWVYVDEADVGAVKAGQDATFTVSAYPTRSYPAHVTRVGYGSTITDNVVTYLTYLDVDNADMTLRPGMTGTAIITATRRDDVLLVPNAALRFTPTAANANASPGAAAPRPGIAASLLPRMPGVVRRSAATGASVAAAKQVWVLREGRPVAVAVTPGISDGHMTEITGGDLAPGMLVITGQKAAVAK